MVLEVVVVCGGGVNSGSGGVCGSGSVCGCRKI